MVKSDGHCHNTRVRCVRLTRIDSFLFGQREGGAKPLSVDPSWHFGWKILQEERKEGKRKVGGGGRRSTNSHPTDRPTEGRPPTAASVRPSVGRSLVGSSVRPSLDSRCIRPSRIRRGLGPFTYDVRKIGDFGCPPPCQCPT